MKPPHTVYRGRRLIDVTGDVVGARVTVNGQVLTADRAAKINKRNHGGFDWGRRGAGPAQLAFALILDATDKPFLAMAHCRALMAARVADWGDEWEITAGEIRLMVSQFEVEEMERLDLQAREREERRCRVCGCTEADCRQCIAAQGYPCCWVPGEPNLCTRCDGEMAAAVYRQKGGAV